MIKFYLLIIFLIKIGMSAYAMLPPPERTVFDLPINTPGLMIKSTPQKVCNQDKLCLCVTLDNELRIYFPTDGTQPTTPEAAAYSCANTDNEKDSLLVTDWYLKMFGLIPINQAEINDAIAHEADPVAPIYVQAGYDKENIVQRIISYNQDTMENVFDMVNDLTDSQPKTRKQFFFEKFNKIASDPVGRVLLYRILIEIRRHDGFCIDALENNPNILLAKDPKESRNRCRSISIIWNDQDFKYDTTPPQSTINFNSKSSPIQVVGRVGKEDLVSIVTQEHNLFASLFHEMLHWFHSLRNPTRMYFEQGGVSLKTLKTAKLTDLFDIGGYFYSNPNETSERIALSTKLWISDSSKPHISLEEMMTVLGAPPLDMYQKHDKEYYYLEGDDLSENLFRVSLGAKFRFGYSDYRCFEKKKVILRAIRLAIKTYFSITKPELLSLFIIDEKTKI